MSTLKLSRLIVSMLVLISLLSCASLRGKMRLLVGSGGGAALGAGGGALFSPNAESRALNALVFGLSGALAGGIAAILTEPPPAPETNTLSLKDRELGAPLGSRQFQLEPASALPPFVRERVQPAVIEEYVESDHVSEDGELHEPHKVYRIKHPVELAPKLQSSAAAKGDSR